MKQQTVSKMERVQTAVEWLVGQLPIDVKMELGFELIEQAKQMEKEQIISAHKEGNKYNGWALRHEHEKYYNETYGTTNSS